MYTYMGTENQLDRGMVLRAQRISARRKEIGDACGIMAPFDFMYLSKGHTSFSASFLYAYSSANVVATKPFSSYSREADRSGEVTGPF